MPLLEMLVSPVLVGRDREMEFLEQELRAAASGAGRCVMIAGEAGIGKSRLTAETGRRATAAGFLTLQGHCFEQDRSFPYGPWIDALRRFLAMRGAAEAGAVLGALAGELVKLLPELSLPPLAARPTPPLEPQAEKHRLFEALIRLCATLAADHPLLIVLEDLHWSDEQSLELLGVFARRIAALPILIIGTHRDEERSPRLARRLVELSRERLAQEVHLAPLARPDVEQMVRAILRSERPLAANWLDILMPLTEGNPFFVEEMLESLAEAGTWPDPPEHPQIPRRIQYAVQRRVERLPDGARHILSLAAVLGDRFSFGLLQEIAGRDELSLLEALKTLIAAGLIVEESAEAFGFRHALTREAIYTALLLRERQALHRRIGETLERFSEAGRGAQAAELAHHYYRAAVWEKTLQYAQRAGEQAQRLYAPREVVTHFSRALEAADRLGLAPAWTLASGRAHARELLGEFDLARIDYELALELARRAEDRDGEWATLFDLGFLWQSRDWSPAADYFERALELARSLGQPALIARSLNRVGNWHMNCGQMREGAACYQQALALFQQLDDRRGVAHTLDLLGWVTCFSGDVIQGAAYFESALPILRELDDRQGLAHALMNLSLCARLDTEIAGALDLRRLADLSETAAQIARSCDWRQGEAEALHRAAMCLARAGEYGRAGEYLRRALGIAEEIGHRQVLTTVHLTAGTEFYPGLLAGAEALAHLEAALVGTQELGSQQLMVMVKSRLAAACVLEGDLPRAQAVLDEMVQAELPDGAELPVTLRIVWSVRAELELALGHAGRALEIVDRLLAGTVNLQAYGPQAVPTLARLRGNALVALGRDEEAATALLGALETARAQGQRPLEWRLHASLGRAYRALGRREDAQGAFTSARALIHELASTLPEGALREHFLSQAFAMVPAPPAPTPRRAAMREFGGLTERERQVAALIAEGNSNREIAAALVLTVRTVEAHVTRILTKLGFRSRAEIAAWAVTRDITPPPA